MVTAASVKKGPASSSGRASGWLVDVGFRESYDAAAALWPGDADHVPTSWGSTHVLTAGAANAPAVVLLHGDGATATAWSGVAARLADRFRVLAPDQPGSPGRSGSSRPFTATAEMVAWVDELLSATTEARCTWRGIPPARTWR